MPDPTGREPVAVGGGSGTGTGQRHFVTFRVDGALPHSRKAARVKEAARGPYYMTHGEAQRDLLVEKYLLNELGGTERDEFEDHLFGCELCAAELKAGFALTEAIRTAGPQLVKAPEHSFATPGPVTLMPKATATPSGSILPGWLAALWNPWLAGPALAACLLILCLQTFLVQPRLHRELAEAQTPEVLSNLMLTSGNTRGGGSADVLARAGGSFLLSVDIAAEPRFREYRCTLVAPSGRSVWYTYLSPAQVNDTVLIRVPVGSTDAGVNVLRVEGIPQTENGPAVALFQRSFTLKIS